MRDSTNPNGSVVRADLGAFLIAVKNISLDH
jgi:hypothetical protein